ncbi:MAG: phosphatidylserine decarboxylase family protein [Pyrinomonadaceae bacterium MAG19_C2-C3]|nr:phosphatidylserine decarboxylase family protein [Pyrinomonadaceae bacterium MAG19_C2-C3]
MSSNRDRLIISDGIPFVIVPAVIALILFGFGYYLVAAIMLGIALFMAYFFRNPTRTTPLEATVVVSPADGRVTRVERVDPDDAQSPTVVSIFLSVFDVHINRAPIAGTIKDVTYTKGRFVIATRSDASLINEQNALTIEGERMTIVCKQIAGVLARRIVCWKNAGDKVQLGERFGLIKFSSRTDLILPPEVHVEVKIGDRVKGAATVIGRLRD